MVVEFPAPHRAHTPSLCQQQLPATGVPITHQRFDQMRDMFDDYVRTRTLQNWKFWVVSSLRPAGRSRDSCVGPGKGLWFCPLPAFGPLTGRMAWRWS